MDKLSSQSDILELASQFERLRADLRHIEIKGEGVQEVVSAYTPELITIANQLMSATPASPAELWAIAKVALWAQNDEIRHRELEGQTVCVILSGSNLSAETLRKVVAGRNPA